MPENDMHKTSLWCEWGQNPKHEFTSSQNNASICKYVYIINCMKKD